MKCLTNNIFFSDCVGIKDVSLLIAVPSKRVNLTSKADMHVYITVHIPAGGNEMVPVRKSGRNFCFWDVFRYLIGH